MAIQLKDSKVLLVGEKVADASNCCCENCVYSVSFDAKIGSGEYAAGYWVYLAFLDPINIQPKEQDGLLGWYVQASPNFFVAATDQASYFDNWHTYSIDFFYDDDSNSWSVSITVDATDFGSHPCGAPPQYYSFGFEATSHSIS